jgi:hypothetical protein
MGACGIEVTVQDVTYMNGPMEKGGVLGSNGVGVVGGNGVGVTVGGVLGSNGVGVVGGNGVGVTVGGVLPIDGVVGEVPEDGEGGLP